MSQTDLATTAAELTLGISRWLIAVSRKHLRTLLIGAALFAVIFLVGSVIMSWYGGLFAKEVVLLVGPAGSTSWRQGDNFANAISKASPAFGLKYRVRQEMTNGYDEIQHRVANDATGTLVGFGFEAINTELNIPKVLVPLDWEYVHILCGRHFIVKTYLTHDWQPKRLTDVLPEIQPGRVYLGPHDSGTRRIAESILLRCGMAAEEFAATGINDWEEAEVAIATGTIDLVFYSGPIGSKTVRNFAKSSILLNLDDIAAATSNEANNAIWVAELEQNTSHVDIHRSHTDAKRVLKHHTKVDQIDENPMENLKFCPEAIKTVSTRGLLICSPAMSAYDAFQIAQSVQTNCPDIPSDVWSSRPQQKTADQLRASEITLPIHAGAQRLKMKQPYYDTIDPRGWPQWFQAALLTLLAAFVSIIMGKMNDVMKTTSDLASAPTIWSQAEALHQEIRNLPRPSEWQSMEPLEDKITSLRQEIGRLRSTSAIEESEFNQLMGYLRELNADLYEDTPDRRATLNHPAPSQECMQDSTATEEPAQPDIHPQHGKSKSRK